MITSSYFIPDTECQFPFIIIFQYCFTCFFELSNASSHLICDQWSKCLKRKRKNVKTILEIYPLPLSQILYNCCCIRTNIQQIQSNYLWYFFSSVDFFPSFSYGNRFSFEKLCSFLCFAHLLVFLVHLLIKLSTFLGQ